MLEERDLTPQDRGEAIPVKQTRKFVRIILVDTREERKQFELEGFMEIPESVYLGQIYTNWNYDELKAPMKGVVADPQASGVNIVFPVTGPKDVLAKDGKRALTFDELRDIFKKYHPTLEMTRQR